MKNNLTLHIINSVPWSNMNRDDMGLPKRLMQGGVLRGMLSSQSIKRAARVDYELNSLDKSYRSGSLPEIVLERIQEIAPDFDLKEAEKVAKKRIGALTKDAAKHAGSSEKESGRSAWLSAEEIDILAQQIVEGGDSDFIEVGRTGALAIAAFGRMFAQAPSANTEAAISVSPAVTTHAAVIETDYFATVDDYGEAQGKPGATYLGLSSYLSGVFYRTVTIDRIQLRKSWSGISSTSAQERLSAMVTSLIYRLPRGKKNSTAPYTPPALVLVEEQGHRLAYDFETPVQANDAEGGFLASTVDRLRAERTAALSFDPDNFGPEAFIAGTFADLDGFRATQTTRQGIADHVRNWILQ